MKVRSITGSLSVLAAVGLLPAGLMADGHQSKIELEKEGIQLIKQVEEVARDVRYNAERLNAFSKTREISKWTHYHHLEQIKSLVNDGLRPALDRLTEIQPQLPEWKQQSIDRLMDAAKALAADTSSAILTKNEAGALPPSMNSEYRGLVGKISAHSEVLVKVSDAAGNYAAARLKAGEAGVEVPRN